MEDIGDSRSFSDGDDKRKGLRCFDPIQRGAPSTAVVAREGEETLRPVRNRRLLSRSKYLYAIVGYIT